MTKKRIAIVLVLVVAVSAIALLINRKQAEESNTNKVNVTTSFYPLAYFTSRIGGDKAEVVNITPAGAEPHEYEPTAQDVVRIEESEIIVTNGAGLEPWAKDIQANLKQDGTVMVRTGEDLANQQIDEDGETTKDPHVWLSPVLAQRMVDRITESFVVADKTNATYYEDNAARLKNDLQDLDTEFREGLANCKSKNIVTSHAAFGYLASTYGLSQVAITGVSPEEEPSPQALAEVADFAKKNNIKYIFFESLVSPELSETLAEEVGAETLVLDPLEGLTDEDLSEGKDYLTVMKANLKNLQIALECTN